MALLLFGCHTEVIKEPRPVDVVLGRIGGTWKASQMLLNNVIKPGYENYTITFSGNDTDDVIYFTTSDRPSDCEFPEFGTLKLGNNIEMYLLVMPDEWPIIYAVDDKQLELTFSSSKPYEPPHEEGEPYISDPVSWVFVFVR